MTKHELPLGNSKFDAWLKELYTEGERIEMSQKNEIVWYRYYARGLTPLEALKEDMKNG